MVSFPSSVNRCYRSLQAGNRQPGAPGTVTAAICGPPLHEAGAAGEAHSQPDAGRDHGRHILETRTQGRIQHAPTVVTLGECPACSNTGAQARHTAAGGEAGRRTAGATRTRPAGGRTGRLGGLRRRALPHVLRLGAPRQRWRQLAILRRDNGLALHGRACVRREGCGQHDGSCTVGRHA